MHLNKDLNIQRVQFHGSTGVGVFEGFIEIILVEEDETGDEPQRGVVSNSGIGEPLLETRDGGILGVGRGEIEGEEFDGLEWCGSIVVDLGDDELELAEGDVAAVDEGVALEGIFLGEVGNVAAVDGGLVSAEVEVVAEVEEVVRCSHYRF